MRARRDSDLEWTTLPQRSSRYILNAADEDMEMSATLDEIFVSEGPGGSAPQTNERWNIYDLWAKRMDQATAEQIVESGVVRPEFRKANWYNSTELSYAEGLKTGDKRLLGQQIGKIGPGGQIKAKVPRHALKMYRLRAVMGERRDAAFIHKNYERWPEVEGFGARHMR